MKLILTPDSNYKDLFYFSSDKWRERLDMHYRSRLQAFKGLPEGFRGRHFKKVYNFGSIDKKIDYPLLCEEIILGDLLLMQKSDPSKLLEGSFDLCLACEVLEHVKNPEIEISRIFSLLASGGYFLVTTPFLAREHKAPEDHQRWTEEGLTQLIQRCGFQIVHAKKRGGVLSVISSFTNFLFFRLLTGPWGLVAFTLSPVFFIIYLVGLVSLRFNSAKPDQPFYLGLTILAKKL